MSSSRDADCTAETYVWPRSLGLPARPPKLVYLDLNHWIELSKAFSGHSGGASYRDALETCLCAAQQGRAVFPISDTIYFEISKIGPYRQRRDLANVIERISAYQVVTARSVISIHEIEAVLDRVLGPRPEPINEMDYLDWEWRAPSARLEGFGLGTSTGEM